MNNNDHRAKRMANRHRVTALILALPLLVNSAYANLIINGSFEGPVLNENGIYQFVQPASWGGGISYYFRGALGGGWPAPQEGMQFVDLNRKLRHFAELQCFYARDISIDLV